MSRELVRVGDVLQLRRREVSLSPTADYTLIGVYSFGKGIFHREPKPGAELGDYRFFEIHPGDLVLSNIQAWEGAIAFATDKDAGTVGTHRFLSYVAKDDRVDTNWAKWFFLSEPGMELIRKAAPGSTTRNRTLAIERFENLQIPIPSIEDQRVAARRLADVHAVVGATEEHARRCRNRLAAVELSWLDASMGGLPLRRLGEAATVTRGRGPVYAEESGLKVVSQGCVQWSGLDMRRARDVEASWATDVPDHSRIHRGDVLVNSTGEGTIGRAAVATDSAFGVPFDSHVLAVRPSSALLAEFLTLFIKSPACQDQIGELKSAKTTKQTELGKANMERLMVPYLGVEEQRAIIDLHSGLAASLRKVLRSVACRDDLMRAIVPSMSNDAFSPSS